jgi:hypothetical protein
LIDGEAVACDDDGLPVFDRLRYRRDDRRVFLYAFDLIELDRDDLRREPIERRKVLLIRLLAKAPVGLQVNDHIVEALRRLAAKSACAPRPAGGPSRLHFLHGHPFRSATFTCKGVSPAFIHPRPFFKASHHFAEHILVFDIVWETNSKFRRCLIYSAQNIARAKTGLPSAMSDRRS